MTPERYQLIGRLFDGALERAPAERATFLEQDCGAAVGLRAAVEKLLDNHSDSEDFLYRILSLLGAGGMGEVYLAEEMRLRRKIGQ